MKYKNPPMPTAPTRTSAGRRRLYRRALLLGSFAQVGVGLAFVPACEISCETLRTCPADPLAGAPALGGAAGSSEQSGGLGSETGGPGATGGKTASSSGAMGGTGSVPATSDATCTDGSCGLTCKNGFKKCGDACIAQSACCSAEDCTSPPDPSCYDATTRRTYSGGSCEADGTCSYVPADETCSESCSGDSCLGLYPVQVAVGGGHTCVLMSDQTVYCWGQAGRLGDGSNANSGVPTQVAGIDKATRLAVGGGNTTCAVLADKTAKCWGYLGNGVLNGLEYRDDALTPEVVPGLAGVNELATNGFTFAALLANGTVRTWGTNADPISTAAPRTLPGITTGAHLADSSTCIVLTDKTVQCWDGADGSPSAQAGLSNVAQVSKYCALDGDGSVRCWGLDEQSSPTLVLQLGAASSIAAASSHVCAIVEADKSLWCWGKDGNFGEIDYGPYPLPIAGIGPVAAVSVAEFNTCAIQLDHVVKCWGDNLFGQLGDGTTNPAATPVTVVGLPTTP